MNKNDVKKLLTLLSVPGMVLLGYAIAGSGGWQHLWPFLLGYLVGGIYAWLQVRSQTRKTSY